MSITLLMKIARTRLMFNDLHIFLFCKIRTPLTKKVKLIELLRLGDIEHMRAALFQYPGLELEAGKMYWITDR